MININLVKENELERLVDNKGNVTNRISLNNNNHNKIIKISPWHPEHYSSIILYKVKLWAEKNNVRVVAEANSNYLPAISQIADEIYLQEVVGNRYFVDATCKKCKNPIKLKSLFYCKQCNFVYDYPSCPVHQSNCKNFRVGYCSCCNDFIDTNGICPAATSNCVRKCSFFKNAPGKFENVLVDYTNPNLDRSLGNSKGDFLNVVAEQISDQEVVERFAFSKIYILESAYKKFLIHKDSLRNNVIMLHTKAVHYSMSSFLDSHIVLPTVDVDYQKELIEKAGSDYMTFQLLGSMFLNWFFICQRGASNILCMLPLNNIVLWDVVSYPYSKIIRGLNVARFGSVADNVPLLENCYLINGKRVELYEYIIENKEHINNFIKEVLIINQARINQGSCNFYENCNKSQQLL